MAVKANERRTGNEGVFVNPLRSADPDSAAAGYSAGRSLGLVVANYTIVHCPLERASCSYASPCTSADSAAIRLQCMHSPIGYICHPPFTSHRADRCLERSSCPQLPLNRLLHRPHNLWLSEQARHKVKHVPERSGMHLERLERAFGRDGRLAEVGQEVESFVRRVSC